SLDHDVIHAELLGAVALRAVDDAAHRHFIEVRTNEPMTEPLFVLPVEIAGSGARVIRNYSILLDPPTQDEGVTQRVTADVRAEQPTAAGQPTAVEQAPTVEQPTSTSSTAKKADTRARVARHRARHGSRRHHTVRNQPRPSVALTSPSAPLSPEQEGLKAQL